MLQVTRSICNDILYLLDEYTIADFLLRSFKLGYVVVTYVLTLLGGGFPALGLFLYPIYGSPLIPMTFHSTPLALVHVNLLCLPM